VPEGPATPAEVVRGSVAAALESMETWLGWDGRGRLYEGTIWTPQKAARRIADHLVDHLAQVEAMVTGTASPIASWNGKSVTLESDWARFTELDLSEAKARIGRLAELFARRLEAMDGAQLGSAEDEWSVAMIAVHVANAMSYYAAQPIPIEPPA
jgi:hypothetical protein